MSMKLGFGMEKIAKLIRCQEDCREKVEWDHTTPHTHMVSRVPDQIMLFPLPRNGTGKGMESELEGIPVL